MSTPRRIVVDDTDPTIKYGPNQWFPHDPNQLQVGNLGQIWNDTSHSTSSNGATLTFPFNGTSISVLGSIIIATNPDGSTDPSYVCLVDNEKIDNGTNPAFAFPENNWLLCNQSALQPGPHELTIRVQTHTQPFYLDSIYYTPTPDISYDGAVLEYLSSDPAITYGSGWEFFPVEDHENITQTKGSQVSIDFRGTALTLVGYVPQELPHNATTASYAVDGGAPTTFTLTGLPPDGTTTGFNVPIFSIDHLAPAQHNVVVTYEGDSTKTPLVVQTFFVTNSTTAAAAAAAASPPSSSGNPPAASSPSGSAQTAAAHSSAGAIAGGLVAGLAVLAALAGLLFWWLRRRARGDA
ncbi:hypothetical protein GGX14DRAFT_315427, partial [Mycena pura]